MNFDRIQSKSLVASDLDIPAAVVRVSSRVMQTCLPPFLEWHQRKNKLPRESLALAATDGRRCGTLEG